MDIKVVENENQVYRKEKLLGEGAFGKAYLVKKILTQEFMVIKEMNIQHMSQKEKDQTIKEALILKNLNHPNIVHFQEVYVTKNNKLKIVMEYAECGDLSKTVHQRKTTKNYIPEAQVLDWFTQICLAIKHVHDRKILHRDIKGQNIFIAKNNSVKLGDFGIARVLNKTMEKARTVVGTPYYLSPEIIENKPYSFKSDIWSMGAVLYELCALQPPFNASSLQMLALKIVKGSYPALQGNYSKELKSLISQMLTLDPNKRPNVNDILTKPVIQDRIKNFLTETKRVAEFSHTVLHNHKVDLGGVNNRLVQIQKQKYARNNTPSVEKKVDKSMEKNIEKERLRLKEEQEKMEKIMKRKKQEEQRKKIYEEERRRRSEQKKIKDEERRKQEAKNREQAKRKWIEKEKMMREYQENRRMAEINRQKQIEEENYFQKEREINELRRQKEQYEERMRRDREKQKIKQKQQQKQKKDLDFQEQARKQYFENLQIRKRAEQRARRERQGYFEEPSVEQIPANYNYNPKRPTSRQQSKPSSKERANFSDYYRSTNEDENRNLLIVEAKKPSSEIKMKSSERKIQGSKKQSATEKELDKDQKKKKIQEQREKMRKDRQNFMYRNKNEENIQQPKVGKWEKRKSSEKRPASRQASPSFGGMEEIKENAPIQQKQQECSIIKDSDNLFLEVKNEEQLNDYINQLEDLVKGVNKKVQILPQIPVAEEIMFRQDDQLEFSLTTDVRPENEELKKMKNQQVDLDYFSNYSKLQILRMQLEEAFGLQVFISLYRFIEKQVSEKGLEGFDALQIQKQFGKQIDIEIFTKNITLLLTLVSLQDNMNYT